MKKVHFPIVLEQDENNVFIVSCPEFKGCHSYGNSIDEALKNIKEVIEICVEEQNQETTFTKFIGIRDLELTLNETTGI